jgi:adenosylcobinamide-GDP ribazoletransferase
VIGAARAPFPPFLRGLRAAFAFLTRVPVGGFPYRPEDWRWASAHFPLVGAACGALVAVLYRALLPLGPLGAAVLALGAQVYVTGALHEDGLADTADALGGGLDRDRVLAILKDSRIGVFGGAALVLSLVGRAALLARLGAGEAMAFALVAAGARVGPVWQMRLLPYVTRAEESKSRDVVRAGTWQAVVATAWFALACTCAVVVRVVAAEVVIRMALALAAVAVAAGFRYRARVGGVTGDFLGATEQLGELAALAVVAWRPI